ncbi:hypothetical protein VP01_96g2 [Puccinia sorghi]|uniref:Uncharacterized protein n=1 Tax=Puccinia sorghi TaxID=27349 RepID=A0A0L6U5Z3_9BASI|nr:hypothetical protein VP01_96g2 [Puccinia sorghi]
MDPSHNAWASSTEQSQNLPSLHAQSSPRKSNPLNQTPTASTSRSQPAKGKKTASMSKAIPPIESASKKKAPAEKTAQRGQRATSAPPVFLTKTPTKVRKPPQETAIVKPKPSPKRHPEQMQTADFPPGFTPTKNFPIFFPNYLYRPPYLSTLKYFGDS